MRLKLILAALGLTLLSACGGSDAGSPDSSSSGSAGSSSSGTVTPPPPEPEDGETTGAPEDFFEHVGTNPFVETLTDPLSTFGVDVDTASYDIFRRDIANAKLPDTASVRVEEYINSFAYSYPTPAFTDDQPFTIALDSAPHIIDRNTHVLRVGIQAAEPPAEKQPANLVFLVDTSASMNSVYKIGLVKELLIEALAVLDDDDRVAIVTYSETAEVALASTEVADRQTIVATLESLQPRGVTAGEPGIQLAYDEAQAAFIAGGINHVIMCTDGDFNVGISNTSDLVDMIVQKRRSGVTFTALGFGTGNLNDAMMERVSNAGNGTYSLITTSANALDYARNRLLSNLIYVAKDMKVQVEFNPALVSSYRLIGYENRAIEDDEFREDQIDAGEIGAGHSVTALYEMVLAGAAEPVVEGAPERVTGDVYDGPVEVAAEDYVLVKIRYKDVAAAEDDPAHEVSESLTSLADDTAAVDDYLQWAVAVATFAEILKQSPYAEGQVLAELDALFAQLSALEDDRLAFYPLFQSARAMLEESD